MTEECGPLSEKTVIQMVEEFFKEQEDIEKLWVLKSKLMEKEKEYE